MTQTLFIGDLHLSADRPDITQAFYHFLATQLDECDALYIIGDLFEVWVGDDIAEPFALEVADKINYHTAGFPVYFIHGNRDFLLGQAFADRAGMVLLPEVTVIDLYQTKTVVLHGDSLCTLDKSYQRFRRFRNWSWVKFLYRQLPRKTRLNIAKNLRAKSQQSNQQKSYTIMDVEGDAVDKLLTQSQCKQMIHGHTHRPYIHHLANDKQRIVVGDWYEQSSVLRVTPQGVELIASAFE
ncbi:UDP-2,3-diacylglucosamine diphosphatase [Shewanella waksmanii]|uniref:UDP-2,3-diacylglucosamine diphosphatase n=1 Tax=Shewanella waksmanii TaxID=213783 RepID=UPI003735F806